MSEKTHSDNNNGNCVYDTADDNPDGTPSMTHWEIGPEKIVTLFDPHTRMKGLLVLDNTILGPACCTFGFRRDVVVNDVSTQARIMTRASALSKVPMGGAAGVIQLNGVTPSRLELVGGYARGLFEYVPNKMILTAGPSLTKDEIKVLQTVLDDRSGVVRYDAQGIGLGLGITALALANKLLANNDATRECLKVNFMGFDATNLTAAKYLSSYGVKITAISDDYCTVSNSKGIDIDSVRRFSCARSEKTSLRQSRDTKKTDKDDIVQLPADILILQGDLGYVNHGFSDVVNAKVVMMGLNTMLSENDEKTLARRNVVVIPCELSSLVLPILAHAWRLGHSIERAYSMLESRIIETIDDVFERMNGGTISDACDRIINRRITEAMEEGVR